MQIIKWQEGKRRGCAYLVGARRLAGEGPDEDLGTWRRAAAAVAQLSHEG